MHSIILLVAREIKLITKDHSLLLTLLLAPIFYAFFYGSIYTHKEEEAVPFVIVDEDQTELSHQLTTQLYDLQILQSTALPSLADAQSALYNGECVGFIWIEKGLSAKVKQLQQADVVLATNAAKFLPSSDIAMAVNQIALAAGAGVRLQYQSSKGLTTKEAMVEAMPVQLDYKPLFNERSSYGAFLLPGLLMLILQQTLLIGLAESTATEREHQLTANWLSLSNYNLSKALVGKGLFYFLLYALYAFFFFTINFKVLSLPNNAALLELSAIIILFIGVLIPMGIVIGSFFTSAIMAMQVMAFSTYPFFLTSGYSWPTAALPTALQYFSNALPTTPFLQMYTAMVQGGAHLSQQLPAIAHLCILGLVYTALALYRIRKISNPAFLLSK